LSGIHYAEKSFPLAQAIPGAGTAGVAERRAPARTQAHPRYPPDQTRGNHDHTPATGQRYSLEHAHHGCGGRYQRSQRAAHLAGSRVETACVEAFKISNDPAFAEKLEDIVGLYLNPPEHALVLCADEKSQIQALDRT